ncbi:RNA 3'-terminal phosphate cyclase/enolpyruvate transferase [Schizophyllum amplum]|uniref:RNA 3'-terminal phosphate cyclase/enolpyruvate transferase n=1 Tax=Schizophyllum amplum TaxID=97359 RepID=A0A550CCX7_9AGAR|nr:RNA 3'-terminal phosphate cyclase/enolpyruvate transferase [Auriculariopsis ampla]
MVAGALAQFSGHKYLRQRLVLSILSGKPVKIDKIRPEDKNPGLRDYEISLLRLLEKLTNGTVIEISVTGTAILVKPGIIAGGALTHDCPLSQAIGYYLEPIIMLAPFAKKPVQLTLRGVTTDGKNLSVDILRTVTLPHLQLFGISDGVELRIKKRGSPPAGGGEVQFLCPIVKQVKTLNFVDPGKIKRIRGVAHAVRVSPQFSNRMIEASRSILNRYIPDIYIYSDVTRATTAESTSPGYALSILADGGCVDRRHQTLVLSMMVLGPTIQTIQFLRDVRQFFGTSFKISPAEPADPDCKQLVYSCYGSGYVNANRTLA